MEDIPITFAGVSVNEQQVEFDQFQRDIEYSETHREELLNQYPEQWVAVLKGKVVGHTPDVYLSSNVPLSQSARLQSNRGQPLVVA